MIEKLETEFTDSLGATYWNGGLQAACRDGACDAGGRCPHLDLANLLMC